MRLFKKQPSFHFMRFHRIALILSLCVIVGTTGLLYTKGLNLGIDFTGGIIMEMRTPQAVDLAAMRGALDKEKVGDVSLQNFGSDQDVMLRVQAHENQDQAAIIAYIKQTLDATVPGIEYRKVDYVGPQVGDELIRGGILAIVFSFIGIMIYVWFRFEWQFGFGGVMALVHDAFITLGFILVTGLEFNLTSIAALLTIVGYSINDSVVIYDRMRENLRKYKKMPLSDLIDLSLNETLSRTILTVVTTLLACTALVLMGGEVIRGFSLVMLFGIIAGTYSSIYISVPLLLYTGLRRDDGAPVAATSEKRKTTTA